MCAYVWPWVCVGMGVYIYIYGCVCVHDNVTYPSAQVGVVLANQLLSERTKRVNGQVVSLLDIVKSLHSNMGINSLMFTITEKSPALVDAERCTLYLVRFCVCVGVLRVCVLTLFYHS
jgi:hypothetical protein